jgi:2',3'-cyclic-nucleotide 2'-phosphodiesterase (5'-nucleotidase family)
MNEVLGNVSQGLTKQKPESTLGNWYTDAMVSAAKKAGYNVDFAISNYGGLRVPEITKGPLTRGEIYELCPFDNMMVIMDLKGNYVDSLFQQIAATEGWPISEGVWMVIQNKKMINCTIHSLLLDPSLTYKVAMPDYVANGGDGLKVLIPLPRTQTGLLVREILMAYAQETALAGKEITATIQGRIVIQL